MQRNNSSYIKVCYIRKYMKTSALQKNTKKMVEKQKVVRVLAQGTFDLLHPGHLHYLNEAKKVGTHLTVIVARDATSARIKKRSTTFSEKMRLQMVRALRVVDAAVLGGKGDILNKVIEIQPNVIVLGYDQHVSEKELKKNLQKRGLHCKIIRASAFSPQKYKSSKLKKKIVRKQLANEPK